MNLYPHQEKIYLEALKNFKTVNRQMIVVPTGGGKTVIFSHLAKKIGKKTLIVAHTKELISQCKATLQKIRFGEAKVTSIQQASSSRNLDFWNDYDFLIIDECHRAGSKSYLRLIDRFKEKKVLGVTATPFRNDGQKLKDILGEKISPLSLLDMINANLLSDFLGYRIRTNISLKGVSTNQGDFICARLAPVVNVKNRNALIVKEYKKIASSEKALCFAVNIEHAEELAKEFSENGVPSRAIHGQLPKSERYYILKEFKLGLIKVLCNCQILTEGFDEPSITCLLMARPTTSKVLYTQMIGRGSRLFPGKEVCKVIEFTDNEYDVSCIEDLISSQVRVHSINQGEKLSKYANRVEKLLEEADSTIVDQMIVVPKSIYEKPATPWQRKFLEKMKISHIEPLTEFIANQLITQASNGIY